MQGPPIGYATDMKNDLSTLSLAALARRRADGTATAEAILRACLDRVAAREPDVQAWATLDPDLALAQARARDKETPRSPLHGLPIAIKDIFDTVDLKTEYGSAAYAGFRPEKDAATVAQFKNAGMVIMGKTVTTEFAAFNPNQTRNPHNPAHTPGGSSSGSAAAVADFMVPTATGTQTLGSVLRPASFCGVIGFKPTYGLVSAVGVQAQAPHSDTIGFFARAAEDLPLLMAAIARNKPGAWNRPVDGAPRIGVIRGPNWSGVEAPMARAVDEAAARLAQGGAQVTDIATPEIMEDLFRVVPTILRYEAPIAWAHEALAMRDRLSPWLQKFLAEAEAVTADDFIAAIKVIERGRAWLADIFNSVDALLTAAAPGEAPRGLGATGSPAMNQAWSLAHGPCIALPFGKGPHALPLGVQLVGGRYDDARLMGIAAWAEPRLGV